MKKKLLVSLLIFSGLIATQSSRAQSPNDNCANASVIDIPNGGFYLGNVVSTTYNISADGVQTGETFAPAILSAGLFKKSMWYEFILPTSRALAVTLLQPGSAIKPYNVGFCIYKTADCLPVNAQISTKLTPIAQFGTTFHPCVDSGVYLIQVSSNDSANGPLYIQLSLDDTDQVKYNFPTTAYNFGVMNDTMECVSYTQNCLTIDNASDYCTIIPDYPFYDRSSWHTFTTGNYSDFAGVAVTNGYPYTTTPYIGIKFYQGNCIKTPVDSLQLLFIDTLSFVNNQLSTIVKKCGLLPNTSYSFELFFRQDFYNTVQVNVLVAGKHAANGPQPVLSALPASNKLGTLPETRNGVTTNFMDYFACNSELSSNACGTVNPAKGVIYKGKKYDLSVWFTFSLSTDATVNFYENPFSYGNPGGCDPRIFHNELVRVFNQAMTNSCSSLDTSNLYSIFAFVGDDPPSSETLVCMPPGAYSVQVLGYDSSYPDIYDEKYPLDYGMLGQPANLSLTVTSLPSEKFDLASGNRFDSINSFKPLGNNIIYTSIRDTFACESTVSPSNSPCDTAYHKAIYREFKVQDSGVVAISNIPTAFYYPPAEGYEQTVNSYQLFRGDASALTVAQNAHSYPQTFSGLTAVTTCETNIFLGCSGETEISMYACVIPGTYTSVATSNLVGASPIQDTLIAEQPSYTLYPARTRHYSGATAQNMGSIIDSAAVHGDVLYSDIDTFSCLDNAVFIDGQGPCLYGDYDTCTKAIYRQFYLSSAAEVTVSSYSASGAVNACDFTGILTVFKGKASDGLNTLQKLGTSWTCLNPSGQGCLQAGWYTVVAYGKGPTYAKPTVNYYWGGEDIGFSNEIIITLSIIPGPKYDRPYKAAVDSVTKAPFSIEWGPRVGSTAAYPVTDTTYTLYPEHFNCTTDTPFSSHPVVPCGSGYNPAYDRVAYYVFSITKPSFINIYAPGFGYYGTAYTAEVFPFDVRTDSAKMITTPPVQPCVSMENYLEICNIQPGVYTLVIFAGDLSYQYSVAPKIYVDGLGTSRFDFATKAYDFGVIPDDHQFHWGKKGDVNPLNAGRTPSDDFFYCTTGAAASDPTDPTCNGVEEFDAAIYQRTTNNYLFDSATSVNSGHYASRNLWYTFVVDVPGSVNIKVVNKTPDKQGQYLFSVYSSPVHDTTSFATLVAKGLVDSTYTSGLVAEVDSATGIPSNAGYECSGYDSLIFTRNNCDNMTIRYYILVENNDGVCGGIDCMAPNSQVEVGIKVDSFTVTQTKFGQYYLANNIGTDLGPGCYQGAQDNFNCANIQPSNPSYNDPPGTGSFCTKTIWYKFSTVTSGYLRRRITINGSTSQGANYENIQLYRQIIPGDSTALGLDYQGYSFYTDSAGIEWESSCIYPGTYYIMLPGCNMLSQNEIPYICIIDDHGDYCDDPVKATVPGPGDYIAYAIIDCHTIGTDYGEFGEYLSCPVGAVTDAYKSTWFSINITGGDTMDVTIYLTDSTNVSAADIEYRLMTGNCNAMQEGSCVENALTRNTYRCLTAGSYFVQVLEPEFVPGTYPPVPVVGHVDLNVNSILHADTCHVTKQSCLATASFTAAFDCNTSDSVIITSYSTYGSDIRYLWSFGDGKNDTTSAVVPFHVYPHLDHDSTYNIKLVLTNISCGGKDSLTVPVLIPARPPLFYLPADSSICLASGTYTLKVKSFPGSTYKWNTYSTDSMININDYTNSTYSVTVTYATCSETRNSTLDIMGPPVADLTPSVQGLCSGGSITLDAYSYYTSTYLWSTGSTADELVVNQPGTYSVLLSNGVCPSVTDSVIVESSTQFRPFPKDTSLCTGSSLLLNAFFNSSATYQWWDGLTIMQVYISSPGTYWVKITSGACTVTDSITVNIGTAVSVKVNAQICKGQSYTLPNGTVVSDSGTYVSTLPTKSGCDSVITTVLAIKAGSAGIAGTVTPSTDTICAGSTVQLIVTGSAGAIQWQSSSNGTSFTDISGAVTDTFTSPALTQSIYYRVKATGSCSTDSSAATFVDIGSRVVTGKVTANPDSVCSGSTVRLTVTGSTGTLQWQSSNNGTVFTDIPGASTASYITSALNQTTYYRIKAISQCGLDSSAALMVKVLPSPVAGSIGSQPDTVCPGTLVSLSLTGNSGVVQWQSSSGTSGGFSVIAGATGEVYTSKLTHTTYYKVVTSNNICNDTSLVFEEYVSGVPVASFTASISNRTVSFNSDSSIGADFYFWDFGDGDTSTQANPIHKYDTTGTYDVCLTARNQTDCNFTECFNVTIFPTGIDNIKQEKGWSIYPNPLDDEIFLKRDNANEIIESIEIYDLLGRRVFNDNPVDAISNPLGIDLSYLSRGMYYLRVRINGNDYMQKIIKQ